MKDNKFLTGFLIVTLLGAGALGFLLFQAKGRHGEVSEAYSQKLDELKTLQGGKPFPNEANFKRVLELQKTHQDAIADLQRSLAQAEIKLEPLTPVKFQDNLNETLRRVRALAAERGTEIKTGDKFSLGFETYQTQPPRDEAAAALGRMLKAIEFVMTALLETSPSELTKDVRRVPLPEEGGQKAPATPAPKGGASAKKQQAEEVPLVKRYPFEIEFVAQEPKVRSFINRIVTEKSQFFVISSVRVTNTVPVGPSKNAGFDASAPPPLPVDPAPTVPADPNQPASAAPAPAPAPEQPQEASKFIVGEEKLSVAMIVEVVDFAEPLPDKTAGKAAAKPLPAK